MKPVKWTIAECKRLCLSNNGRLPRMGCEMSITSFTLCKLVNMGNLAERIECTVWLINESGRFRVDVRGRFVTIRGVEITRRSHV